jgi:PAS domain S-box-containing protein
MHYNFSRHGRTKGVYVLKRTGKSAPKPKRSRAAAGKRPGAQIASRKLRRTKPDADIAGRLRFESFLLELSAYFVKAPVDAVDRGIDEWLAKLARFIGVDRISLWECDSDGSHMRRLHVFSNPGLKVRPPFLVVSNYPWVSKQYQLGKIVTWGRVPDDIPDAAAAERADVMRMGAKSVLGIPIQAGNTLYVLSFADMRRYRKWPKTTLSRLQLVGEVLASAILRQRTERSLLASEVSQRALLRTLPDLIFVLSPDDVFVECHCPNSMDLLMPREQFMGRRMADVLPPDMDSTFRSAFRLAADTGEVVEVHYGLPVPGDDRRFEARVVLRDDGAKVAVVRNITESHRAADRLRDSEERFRAAFTHSAIGIALLSLDGHWLQVNAALCRILGYSEAELLSTTFQALTHPDDLEPNREYVRRALAGEISHYEMDKRYLHKDGRVIWALLAVALVRNASNEPLYFVSQLQDVTERRQAQIEIERARLELAHLGRVSLVGQLTSSLAHELLQPITVVVSNAEAGLHGADLGASVEMRAMLEDIAESGRRAGDIIHHVRDMLRKERGAHMTVDLNGLVQEVAQVMRSDLLLHQVRLSTHLASGNAQISGDRGELQQVLLNLVLNGTEAMNAVPIGERQLSIATVVHPNAVELSVQDQGTGAPPASLARLTEPFFTTKPNGVGMGLSICADIVRAHHGQLLGENNADRGMIWRCILPRG